MVPIKERKDPRLRRVVNQSVARLPRDCLAQFGSHLDRGVTLTGATEQAVLPESRARSCRLADSMLGWT